MATKVTLQTTNGGTRVVLTNSSATPKRARMTTVRLIVYPAASDPSVLPDGNIELSFEQQTQSVYSDRAHIVAAEVWLTPDECVEWLLAAATSLLQEDRVRSVERLNAEPFGEGTEWT